MKSRKFTCPLLIVVLVLVLPALVGCSSGAATVQAKPQNPADLTIPDQPARAVE